jgi:hypothetical protein
MRLHSFFSSMTGKKGLFPFFLSHHSGFDGSFRGRSQVGRANAAREAWQIAHQGRPSAK